MEDEKQPPKEPAFEVAPLGAALTPGLIPAWSMRKKAVPANQRSSWKPKPRTSKRGTGQHPTK